MTQNQTYLKEMKKALSEVIELHTKMKNSYFWNPSSNASSRRWYEKQHSFQFKNNILDIECSTRCSCKNIFYFSSFVVEGKKTNFTKIKNIYNALCELV